MAIDRESARAVDDMMDRDWDYLDGTPLRAKHEIARLREIERIVRYVATETYAGANDELLLMAQGRAFRKMVRWLAEIRFP